ncbi:hypothetical protein EV424DRAFT_861924 [Suillus variegatus]|nr:hypothetical protein EV424DRAFT_861924 [Suillus variegatus]
MSVCLRTGSIVLYSLLTKFTVLVLCVHTTSMHLAHAVSSLVSLCQASTPLTPRQVLPNIFAVSVLISTSTLYAASRPTTVTRQCRITCTSVPRQTSCAASMPRQTSSMSPQCRVKPHRLNCHTVRIT